MPRRRQVTTALTLCTETVDAMTLRVWSLGTDVRMSVKRSKLVNCGDPLLPLARGTAPAEIT